VPFRSDAQRKYLWANHPEVAREFAAGTPKGAKLPEHVKKGALDALSRFGMRPTGEELRLKIPDRTFHGFDAATRAEAERGHAKKANNFGDRRSSEDLAQLLQEIDDPPNPGFATASRDPLDRTTNWGPPSSMAAGDAGSRAGVGPSGFGGV
jgi:hypothetical protein